MADNLLEMVPSVRYPLERDAEGNARIAIPKFKHGIGIFFCRLFGLGKNIYVKLDEKGEYIYSRCDGSRTVGNLVKDAHGKFGESIEPAVDRVCEYIRILERNKIVLLRKK